MLLSRARSRARSHTRSAVRTRLTAGIAAGLTAVLAAGALAVPAEAARVSPGDFTGFAFDSCTTPDQATMDTWLKTSPFWGVGVYIGGAELSDCTRASGLVDSGWVTRQSRRGWRVLPIWVGPQASCSTRDFDTDIDPREARSYAAARAQGRAEANRAVRAASALGVRSGSTLWYDIEDFDVSRTECRRSVLSFLSSWTGRLHALGWKSGVYSNVAAGIHALDNADKLSPGSYAMPDQVWYAWGNGRANTYIAPKWVRAGSWKPHARIHQYILDRVRTYGGASLKIDHNFMDVGRGSIAPRPAPTCGVNVNFGDYRSLRRGSTGAQVKALQCLLKQKKRYDGRVHGRYDARTHRAVRSFQRLRGLGATGRTNARTWTVLLAEGKAPVLKRGSVGEPVRRVQRGLTAALNRKVAVTGVFDAATTNAVLAYQQRRGLVRTGVMADDTWAQLVAGRI
jgi:hypothetical protein